METGIRSTAEHIEEALNAADMAWWSLEFPVAHCRFLKRKLI